MKIFDDEVPDTDQSLSASDKFRTQSFYPYNR